MPESWIEIRIETPFNHGPAGDAGIRNGQSTFWLDSDQAGARAVTVSLTATCQTVEPNASRLARQARHASNAR